MKNFKAEKITTPGVIGEVKKLFKGYNKLILGFNTFLPDGENHKIELTDEEQASDLGNASQNTEADRSPALPVAAPGLGAGVATGFAPSQQRGGGAGGGMKSPKNQQQQHAITYVTTIRNRFASEPDIYRSFLKILHTYQREQKGIKDVREQVSSLFADHPDLLMEFTYFLPDAVQEQAKERLQR